MWKEIEALTEKSSLTVEEEEELATQKHAFTFILSAVETYSILGGVPHSLAQLIYKRFHMTYSVLWTIRKASNTSH